MGDGADAGLTQIDPAVDLVRDGGDNINRLGDELVSFYGSYWCATETVNATSMANNVYTTVGLDTLVNDDYGAGLSVGGTFVVPQTGRYKAWGLIAFGSLAAAGTHRGVAISRNGSYFDTSRAEYPFASTAITLLPSPIAIMDLIGGDTIELVGVQDTGAARNTVITAAARSCLYVQRLK